MDDSLWLLKQTIIKYHGPFDQGLEWVLGSNTQWIWIYVKINISINLFVYKNLLIYLFLHFQYWEKLSVKLNQCDTKEDVEMGVHTK